jgi:hypothetical protein
MLLHAVKYPGSEGIVPLVIEDAAGVCGRRRLERQGKSRGGMLLQNCDAPYLEASDK